METKCKDRVQDALDSRMEDIKVLWENYQAGIEDAEIGNFNEYGLCFDYVGKYSVGIGYPNPGYFRYQISWGGPSEEFRFMTMNPDALDPEIDFWLLDWFDGAKVTLTGEYREVMLEIWEFFKEIGSTQHEYEKWEGDFID